VQNEQGIFEIEIVRKDGTLVPVEVNAHLFYLQGKPVVLAITRDITERKRTETAIREAHQRLVEILEFLPDPVFVLDTEGRVTAWNRAMEELTGTKMEDVIGKGDFAYSVAFITKSALAWLITF
jgi:PAS domain-containing protein